MGHKQTGNKEYVARSMPFALDLDAPIKCLMDRIRDTGANRVSLKCKKGACSRESMAFPSEWISHPRTQDEIIGYAGKHGSHSLVIGWCKVTRRVGEKRSNISKDHRTQIAASKPPVSLLTQTEFSPSPPTNSDREFPDKQPDHGCALESSGGRVKIMG